MYEEGSVQLKEAQRTIIRKKKYVYYLIQFVDIIHAIFLTIYIKSED